MIAQNINKMIAEALKAREELRLSTLRLLSSALNYEKIAKQHDLSEEEEMAVVKREASKRRDAIEALRQAQGKPTTSSQKTLDDRLVQEEKELEILKSFLPPEMSDAELEIIVDESINALGAQNMSDMGKVIGLVMSRAKGAADGRKVAEMVKSKLG
ncbi:hypothetical protein A2962_04440 [Candidatus Woesebacteria bacterium RIFCSPLOWO2_01_FULL_39_61]|uniref:Glutamyl-tRNA amidotransferase n=1 Tax=Candidatus Woesebacteria bacterium RIFCSPHIGHO2_02_FULL_39_13 TaxID=1802505 RepID=A0A1F7Z806_9BACT|nr:MAG: hypothetical protein A2692_03565 [Candidatus Woesebacteria bacterium RIFCSPHIGHO2_01_FULL_39_95]OGM34885.1 MAG: hypothetical protein A3D01_00210 [Candidatus Woesebacteria bacterium RIFCSPHIGHO2_02_FULL_39_13]OGM38015.1 MAG: hypothetical protein A3E13_05435 [Candidatus Woesebacteria bacterium RIFCSPHIGHO2_12_FULL_40_20]OGM66631.1 MAG: hypothetical protein A2962_04440 [Candidatus Woesebacteria bacterium RIFCSPLOWO2_01_FULL_39_61]OGM73732.1 MAG: hypothetical protein A3H19_05060 [Candidatus